MTPNPPNHPTINPTGPTFPRRLLRPTNAPHPLEPASGPDSTSPLTRTDAGEPSEPSDLLGPIGLTAPSTSTRPAEQFGGLAEPDGLAGAGGLIEAIGLLESARFAEPAGLARLVGPAESADPVESADPAEPAGAAEFTGPAGPDDHDAELVGARHEIGEYLTRRRDRAPVKPSGGLCLCEDGASTADRSPRLLPVGARLCDPLDVKRLVSRARLGAILGHCRCEPGAVAA